MVLLAKWTFTLIYGSVLQADKHVNQFFIKRLLYIRGQAYDNLLVWLRKVTLIFWAVFAIAVSLVLWVRKKSWTFSTAFIKSDVVFKGKYYFCFRDAFHSTIMPKRFQIDVGSPWCKSKNNSGMERCKAYFHVCKLRPHAHAIQHRTAFL